MTLMLEENSVDRHVPNISYTVTYNTIRRINTLGCAIGEMIRFQDGTLEILWQPCKLQYKFR